MRNPADVLDKAELHEEKGNYVEAERLFKKALTLKAREAGDQSFELAPFLYSLGMSQYVNDHYDDALLSLTRLLDVLTRHEEEIAREIREIRNVISEVRYEAEESSQPLAANA